MRYVGVALACAGLLIQAAGARAIQFAPPRTVAADEEVAAEGKKPIGLTVGLAASSWDLPDTEDVKFDSQVRPLLTAEYQINPKWAVGGWLNAIAWDATLSGYGKLADVDGTMWEIHGTYALPSLRGIGLSAQLGYQRADFDLDLTPAGLGKESISQDWITAWALGTYAIKRGEEPTRVTLLGGLGVQQAISEDYKNTEANALLGASYAFTPQISGDVSVWFSDFLRSDSVVRFTAGVTGRF